MKLTNPQKAYLMAVANGDVYQSWLGPDRPIRIRAVNPADHRTVDHRTASKMMDLGLTEFGGEGSVKDRPILLTEAGRATVAKLVQGEGGLSQ